MQMGVGIRQSVADVDTDSLLSQNWPPSPPVRWRSCSETDSATTEKHGRKKTEKYARNATEFLISVDLGKVWPPLHTTKTQIIKDGVEPVIRRVNVVWRPPSKAKSCSLKTPNKQGAHILKTKCCIYSTLISYHNSSWTCVATHILSHSIGTSQDIAAAADLASKCEANGSHSLSTSCQLHLQ